MTLDMISKAYVLWENGVAVGQIAHRCGMTRDQVFALAESRGWSSRKPERLHDLKHAPVAPPRPVPVRVVPRGVSGKPEE